MRSDYQRIAGEERGRHLSASISHGWLDRSRVDGALATKEAQIAEHAVAFDRQRITWNDDAANAKKSPMPRCSATMRRGESRPPEARAGIRPMWTITRCGRSQEEGRSLERGGHKVDDHQMWAIKGGRSQSGRSQGSPLPDAFPYYLFPELISARS